MAHLVVPNVVELSDALFDLCGAPSSLTPMLSVRDSKVSLKLDCTRSVSVRARNQIVRDPNERWGVAFPGVCSMHCFWAPNLFTRYVLELVSSKLFKLCACWHSYHYCDQSHIESDRSGWLHSPAAQCCAFYRQACNPTIFIQGAAMFVPEEEKREGGESLVQQLSHAALPTNVFLMSFSHEDQLSSPCRALQPTSP
jgi:hypothetical protein